MDAKGKQRLHNRTGSSWIQHPHLTTAGLLPAPEMRFYTPRCVCVPPLPRNTGGGSFCFWKSLPDSQTFPLLRSWSDHSPAAVRATVALLYLPLLLSLCSGCWGGGPLCKHGLTPLCTSGDWPETEYFENSELR